ncbi:MAG: hypothetical protein H7Z75_16040 [Ferruginibacter sp.]|nr:hypothetical protein [Cytophagales bacterium]
MQHSKSGNANRPGRASLRLGCIRFGLAVVVGGLFNQPLRAQTAPADSPGEDGDTTELTPAEDGPKARTQIKGFAEFDQISYWKTRDDQKVYGRNQGILQLEINSALSKKITFFGGVELREDVADRSRNRVFLDESYVNFFLKNLDLRLGKQIITWGRADGINYTNNLNPVDYSDLLDTEDETMGVFALRSKYYLKAWTLEGIVVPVFTPSILPQSNSPWFRDLPAAVPHPYDSSKTIPVSYDPLLTLLPRRDWRSAQWAGRIAKTIAGLDFSVSYYRGFNDLPRFRQLPPRFSPDSVRVVIQAEFNRWQIWGADLAASLGKFELRGEGAYFIPKAGATNELVIDKPYFQYVVGIDRTFSDAIGSNAVFVLLQWIQEVNTTDVTYSSQDLNHLFQRSVAARIECGLGNYGKLSVQGIYNLKPKDYYLRPVFTYQISDGLNATVMADILGGRPEGFFGSYGNNNRIQARLKYNF